MRIFVNGQRVDAADQATLADVVGGLGHDPSLPGVAAAVDGEVVPRLQWPHTVLADGQTVEVLTAVQGGA